MPKPKLTQTQHDAINLDWAKGVLADPLAEHRIGIGLVKVARMVVERIEGSQTLSRPEPAEGKES